jgi:hypothetical protein
MSKKNFILFIFYILRWLLFRLSKLRLLNSILVDKLSISSYFCGIFIDLGINFASWTLELICCWVSIVWIYSLGFLWNIRNVKYLLDLMIKEDYLLILCNKYSIIVDLNQVAKHVNQLLLLSCTLEIISVSLIKGSCKKVYEHKGNAFIYLDSCISHKRYVIIIFDREIYKT